MLGNASNPIFGVIEKAQNFTTSLIVNNVTGTIARKYFEYYLHNLPKLSFKPETLNFSDISMEWNSIVTTFLKNSLQFWEN